MKIDLKNYRKLMSGSLFFRICPGPLDYLYAGEDHLLLVQRRLFVEQYKRFYFREINYVTFKSSPGWIFLSAGLGLLFAILLGTGIALSDTGRLISFGLSAICVLLLLLSLAAGRGYSMIISTAAQTVRAHIRCRQRPAGNVLLQELKSSRAQGLN
jgi:hypothetical protein